MGRAGCSLRLSRRPDAETSVGPSVENAAVKHKQVARAAGEGQRMKRNSLPKKAVLG